MNKSQVNFRVHFNQGRGISPVGFVFACPGRKEQIAGKVVAGSTGNNLNLLLASLSCSSNKFIASLFPSSNRYDYFITNASDIVHYPALDGRSLPAKKEYMNLENIERLSEEIAHLKCVIAFGAQAKDVVQAVDNIYVQRQLQPKPIFIKSIPHLSFLSLNQISVDVHGDPILPGERDGTQRRIEVVRDMLEKQIQNIME